MSFVRAPGGADRSWALDVAGLGLLGGLAAWVGLAGARNGVDSQGAQLVVLGTGAAHMVGRWSTRSNPFVVPAGLWAVGVLIVAHYGERILENPTGPFGYANAAAAFATVLCGAALFATTLAQQAWVRIAWTTAALGALVFPWVNGSLAAALATILLPVVLTTWMHLRDGRRPLVVCAVLAGLCLTGSVGLAVSHDGSRGAVEDVLPEGLTGRRTILWNEAWQMLAADPVDGVGPGGFARYSPTARADPDASWAHNLYLHVAAETGVPGAVLLLLLAGWAYLRLTPEREVPAGPTVVGATLTALLIHSTVDYVLHFPVILLGLAALHGAGTARAGPVASLLSVPGTTRDGTHHRSKPFRRATCR